MERVRVLTRGGLTVSPNGTAVLPVAVPRSRRPSWGWFHARGGPRNGESRSRTHCLEREQVVCSLALLACGILFGLSVGGFVGFMENATPHAGSTCGVAHLTTSGIGWMAMVRQSRAIVVGDPISLAANEQASPWQQRAAGSSAAAGQPVAARWVLSAHPVEARTDREAIMMRRSEGGRDDAR